MLAFLCNFLLEVSVCALMLAVTALSIKLGASADDPDENPAFQDMNERIFNPFDIVNPYIDIYTSSSDDD